MYNFQRSLPASTQLEKVQAPTAATLDLALEGAHDVLYFTHDYLAMTGDKNNFLTQTAKSAKK